MPKQNTTATVFALAFLSGDAIAAAQKDFSAIIGVGHSDNVRKENANEQSETIKTAGVDFSIMQDTRRLSLDAAADLEYLDYQTSAYDGVIGNFNGSAVLKFVPDRFEWVLQENFGQVLSNSFLPETPDNRQNINYFSTGPNFTLGFGGANKATLSGRYSKVNYASAAMGIASGAYEDNDRYSAALALIHELSVASEVSLNLQSEKVNFSNDSPVADYTQKQAFLHYGLRGSRTKIETDAGYTQLSGSSVDDGGYLARLSIERKSTQFSTISLRLGHEFSDVGASFRLQQGLQPTGLQAQSTPQTSNPFVSEYASLGWRLDYPRTSIGLGFSYFDDSYDKQPAADQTRKQADLSVGRLITPNLRLTLTGNYFKADPRQSGGTVGSYHEIDSTATVSWQFTRHLSCDLQFSHFDRTSDLPVGNYQENVGWLKLRYGLARQ